MHHDIYNVPWNWYNGLTPPAYLGAHDTPRVTQLIIRHAIPGASYPAKLTES